MAYFKVTEVIDGSTFTITPGWKWQEQTGYRVRAAGYSAPGINEPEGRGARDKLSGLVLGRYVELKAVYKVDNGQLVCDVFFPGVNLAEYFPEYAES